MELPSQKTNVHSKHVNHGLLRIIVNKGLVPQCYIYMAGSQTNKYHKTWDKCLNKVAYSTELHHENHSNKGNEV